MAEHALVAQRSEILHAAHLLDHLPERRCAAPADLLLDIGAVEDPLDHEIQFAMDGRGGDLRQAGAIGRQVVLQVFDRLVHFRSRN